MKPAFLLLATCLAIVSSGCSGMFKGKAAAEKGVVEFHQLYNDAKLEQIYDDADAKLKRATPKKDFLDFLAAMERKLGKVTASTGAGFNVRTFNLTTTVVLNQNTTFEHGSGTEVFTFEINGGKALLVGYDIHSKDMMMK